MRFLFAALFALLALAGCTGTSSANASASDEFYMVTLSVVSESGDAIEGARVVIEPENDFYSSYIVGFSDGEKEKSVEVNSGRHKIVATAEGYASAVLSGQDISGNVSYDFVMKRSG